MKMVKNKLVISILLFSFFSCTEKGNGKFENPIKSTENISCDMEVLFSNETFEYDITFDTGHEKPDGAMQAPKFELIVANEYIDCFKKITKTELIKLYKSEKTDFAVYTMLCKVHWYSIPTLNYSKPRKQHIIDWRKSINKSYHIENWRKEDWFKKLPNK